RQDFTCPPLPRMTNTYMHGGDSSPEDILRSVTFGVFASDFDNGVVDTLTGDFNFTPKEAYLIESGKITAPISNLLLIGNGPEVLKRVTMVGHDLKFSDTIWTCVKQGQEIPVSVGMPTIKIDNILMSSGTS
ncbi:MAG: metallopeptidase TldD-related protein, partial [Blastocatellia bacterium]